MSDEDLAGVDGPLLRVELATDLGGNRRPQLDRLPKRAEVVAAAEFRYRLPWGP